MRRFVEGLDRGQSTLFPECLEDWIGEDNPVRVIDVFVDELDLAELGFSGVDPEMTGRPSYHPSALLNLYIYGYLNRVQSSRRLERDAGRNVEVMWLTEIDQPTIGSLVLYFSGSDWKHVGIVTGPNRVTSQWGTFPIYEHDVCEIPASYGNQFDFSKCRVLRAGFPTFWITRDMKAYRRKI